MKKFKSKKVKKISIFKITFFILLTLFFFNFFTNTLFNFKLANSNQEFIAYMLKDSNHHLLYENKFSIIKTIKQIFNIDLSSKGILETVFGKEIQEFEDEEIGNKSEYVYDPNPAQINEPKVYIYNTHQLESYDNTDYNDITPNVLMASYLLKEELNKAGIPTIVESSNITEYIKQNNLKYYQSYDASRYYAEKVVKDNQNLDLVIDLHRDAIEKNASTVTINDKEYAKLLFVIGMEHENYESNLEVATAINNIIKEKYPTLTRGIITKSGKNVNGIYNQDLNPNSILIECGGYKNSFSEVVNTINLLSQIIKEYLNGRN